MTKQLSIFAMLALTATTVTAQDAHNAKGVAFFEKKIRPVLVQHCYKCHAADSKSVRGGLLLDTRSGTRKGGDSGPAVVPHKLDESLLIESLRYDGYEMPPSGKLPDAVIRDFEKWIEMGAPDPRDGESITTSGGGMDLEAGREFWAFKPPIDHPAPKVRNRSWPSSDIDRFVLSKIEQNDMEPAADADKRTLLRRVYFDLIGLPPSPADIDAFLKDPSDHAFESVVDELLASRHFGERWGRHWLDVARYSDSTGGGRSLLFKVSWRYRNYVIDAFNRGTPFDQFIIDQIAGDLIPDQDDEQRARSLTATGFLALGPTNYENQDKRQLRMDVVDEQIDTIGRAFLGMTIGCARCHDHKFDPIPTSDYYAMAGIFRSTRSLIDGNVSKWITRPLPTSGVDPELGRKIAEAEKQLKASQKRIRILEKQTVAVTIDDTEAELSGKWTESTFVKGFVGKRYVHSVDPAAKAIYTFAPAKSGRHELFASYTHGTNRAAAAPISVVQGKAEIGSKNLDQRPVPDNQFVSLGEFDLVSAESVHVTVRPVGAPQVVIADAIRLEFIGDEKQQTTRRELNDARSKVATLKQQLVTLRKAENDAANVLSVDEEKQPGDFHICIRGNVRNLGQKVHVGS